MPSCHESMDAHFTVSKQGTTRHVELFGSPDSIILEQQDEVYIFLSNTNSLYYLPP